MYYLGFSLQLPPVSMVGHVPSRVGRLAVPELLTGVFLSLLVVFQLPNLAPPGRRIVQVLDGVGAGEGLGLGFRSRLDRVTVEVLVVSVVGIVRRCKMGPFGFPDLRVPSLRI